MTLPIFYFQKTQFLETFPNFLVVISKFLKVLCDVFSCHLEAILRKRKAANIKTRSASLNLYAACCAAVPEANHDVLQQSLSFAAAAAADADADDSERH